MSRHRNMSTFTLVVSFLFPLLCQGFLFWGEKCYGDLGCFDNKSPFDNAQSHRPDSPEHIATQFRLFTRKNPTHQQVLDRTHKNTISGSHFVGSHKTVFIVHGYQDTASSTWVKDMTAALLRKENMNVIAVDWSKGADYINYFQAAANTRVVGAVIAKMMEGLHSTAHAAYSNMHVVGHSLGAHIGGYAGERIHGLGRITGLDPAGPCFEEQDVQVRLDPNDANYVDVIHTDGDNLLALGFGCDRPLGDADFYPNGGVDQPGCPAHIGNHLFTLVTGQISQLKDGVACSHMRVLDLFTESITSSCKFQSIPCSSKSKFDNNQCTQCGHGCADMGYNSSPRNRGTFYLKTSDGNHRSYCKN